MINRFIYAELVVPDTVALLVYWVPPDLAWSVAHFCLIASLCSRQAGGFSDQRMGYAPAGYSPLTSPAND